VAAEQEGKAERGIAKEREDAGEKVADANRDVAMARIEGEHKVARERLRR